LTTETSKFDYKLFYILKFLKSKEKPHNPIPQSLDEITNAITKMGGKTADKSHTSRSLRTRLLESNIILRKDIGISPIIKRCYYINPDYVYRNELIKMIEIPNFDNVLKNIKGLTLKKLKLLSILKDGKPKTLQSLNLLLGARLKVKDLQVALNSNIIAEQFNKDRMTTQNKLVAFYTLNPEYKHYNYIKNSYNIHKNIKLGFKEIIIQDIIDDLKNHNYLTSSKQKMMKKIIDMLNSHHLTLRSLNNEYSECLRSLI